MLVLGRFLIGKYEMEKLMKQLLLLLLGLCFLLCGAGCAGADAAMPDLMDESRTASEEEKNDDLAAYRTFVQENYQRSAVSTLLADLTGDGVQDLIVVRNDSLISVEVYTLNEANDMMCLYQESIADTHAGWRWLYLYEENGKKYLFRYSPWAGQGYADYQYQIFSFSQEGEETVRYEGEKDCRIMPEDEKWKETWDDMQLFLEQIHAYQKASIPLVEIGNDYFDTEYGCMDGREYHYVIESDELGIGSVTD